MNEIKTACLRDVIHDYIYFTLPQKDGDMSEKAVIDSPWLQRLRRINQLQAAWMVYPCATHTRFQHSLGAMHLAGNMAYRLYDSFKKAFPGEYIPPEKNYVEELFRLAGLLHDVGHGPFGHLMDEVYTWKLYGKTHEDISAKVIRENLAQLIEKIDFSPHGYFSQKIKIEDVIKFIKTPADFSGYELWEQIFCKIMMGIYSVDIIDFLLRDKYYCGTTEFGDIDIKRLLGSATITSSGFSMDKDAIPALKSFLSTRMSMFCHIYFNEKKELFQSALGRLLPDIIKMMKIGNPYENIKKYFFVDDFSLTSMLTLWSRTETGQKKELGKQWEKIAVMRDTPDKLVLSGQKSYFTFVRKEELLTEEKIVNNFRQHYNIKCPVSVNIDTLDIRLQNVFVRFNDKFILKKEDNLKSISLYDSGNDTILGEEMNKVLQDIPVKFLLWQVFVPSKYSRRVQAVIKAESDNGPDIAEAQMSLPLGPARWNENKEKTEITNV